jgi:hypothetical protein
MADEPTLKDRIDDARYDRAGTYRESLDPVLTLLESFAEATAAQQAQIDALTARVAELETASREDETAIVEMAAVVTEGADEIP